MAKRNFTVSAAIFLFFALLFVPTVQAKGYKVLVVMSYEIDYPWDMEVKEGIDSVLSDQAEIRYFYMNTKTDLADSAEKGKEAYEL